MSIKQDLPSEPSDRYSQGFIEVCDKYRKRYRKIVNDTSFLRDPENSRIPTNTPYTDTQRPSDNFSRHVDARNLARVSWIKFRKPSTQVLMKLELCGYRDERPYFTLFCNDSIVQQIMTAIYVPSFVNKIEFSLYTGYAEFKIVSNMDTDNKEETKNLDILLEETKTIPTLRTLEDLMKDSKNPEHVFFNHHPREKWIQGQKYKRVSVIHPYLPVNVFPWYVSVSELCEIYIELNIISLLDEPLNLSESFVGFIDGSPPYLVHYDCDLGYTLYDHEGKQVKDQDIKYFKEGTPTKGKIELLDLGTLNGNLFIDPLVTKEPYIIN